MTSSLALRAAQFREQTSVGRLLPNAWDAASARIFEATGFSANRESFLQLC